VQELAGVLTRASSQRQRVAVRGGGTKVEWGVRAQSVDLLLSTRRLNAVLAHRYGDLTATVEAGAVLDDVNRELAKHGQSIPLDPLWSDRATIGGIVATNDSGPRRHRYGTPRDLIIGVGLVRMDGVLARAGGIVVKNVAGYDIARLVTGSFGSLGVIVEATFKLYPVPRASRTVVVAAASHRTAGAVLSSLAGSQLTPTAIELQSPPPLLLIRFESSEASVETQSRDAARLAETAGAEARIDRDEAEAHTWIRHRTLWERAGTIAKVTLLPSDVIPALDWIAGSSDGLTYEIAGRAALGVLFLRLDGPVEAESRLLTSLRERIDRGRGSVVLLRASDELKDAVDVWGPPGDALPLMRAVKHAFDPDGLLNPGRGPGGL
jgi:glycolate oxidase FAD binding subunit